MSSMETEPKRALNSVESTRMACSPEHATMHPLHVEEGVFLPDDLRHDNRVIDVRSYKPAEQFSEGVVAYNRYTLSDGVQYNVAEGLPKKQRTSIPVDSTTAWWTQPEGHNAHTDLKLMELGFPFRRIGPERIPNPEGVCLSGIYQSIRKGLDVGLGYTAHNMLEILDAADAGSEYTITPGVSFHTGESRGAMVEPALQILARSRHKKRLFVHSDAIDPCCPQRIPLTDPVVMTKLAISEGEAIARTAWHILRQGHIKHYRDTVDFSIDSIVPTITAARGLLTGQAGEHAKLRPHNARKHLTFMRRSYANQHEIFEDIYKDQPHVYIQRRGGGHLDIPRTLRGVLRRHASMLDDLERHEDDPTMVDFDKAYERPLRNGRGLLKLVVNS